MRDRIAIGALLTVLFSTNLCGYAQPQGPWGFNWYGDDEATTNGSTGNFSVLFTTTGRFYRMFTIWTPPSDYDAYQPYLFKAILGVTGLAEPSLDAPSYPGYEVAIYDDHLDFMGVYDVDDARANYSYLKRYRFFPPYDTGVSFQLLPGSLYYPTGGGTFTFPRYEVVFDLTQADEVDPPGELALEAGTRYWFNVAGLTGTAENGYVVVARTLPDIFPSPEPDPPVYFEMSPEQCADWGRPFPCQFRLATSDYFKIAEPASQQLCWPAESPVNHAGAPYEPRLPIPNCFNNTNFRPCCDRGFAARFAMALYVTGLNLPVNDNCSQAPLLPIPSSTIGDTTLASADPAAPFCMTPVTAPGVWYAVIGTGTQVTVSLCGAQTTYDAKLSVYNGDCSSLNCVTGADDSCGLRPQVSWCAQDGQQYLILVQGVNGAVGQFEMVITQDNEPCGAPCQGVRGDANCSGDAPDFFDIDPFLEALFDLPGYLSTYCTGSICAADIDCSGSVDFFDIDPLLQCIFSSCAPCP